jgi:hypothetical protein
MRSNARAGNPQRVLCATHFIRRRELSSSFTILLEERLVAPTPHSESWWLIGPESYEQSNVPSVQEERIHEG